LISWLVQATGKTAVAVITREYNTRFLIWHRQFTRPVTIGGLVYRPGKYDLPRGFRGLSKPSRTEGFYPVAGFFLVEELGDQFSGDAGQGQAQVMVPECEQYVFRMRTVADDR